MSTRLAHIAGRKSTVIVTRFGCAPGTTCLQLTTTHPDGYVQLDDVAVVELVAVLSRWMEDPMYEPSEVVE